MSNGPRVAALIDAFERDEYGVHPERDVFEFRGRVGIRARHSTATNTQTGKPKRAYYVEGNGYESGYLLGLMAPGRVKRMSTEYVDRVPFELIDKDEKMDPRLKEHLGRILTKLLHYLYPRAKKDLPREYRREIRGLIDGCRARGEKIEARRLWVLNIGIDCLLPLVYAFDGWLESYVPVERWTRRILAWLRRRVPFLAKLPHRGLLDELRGRLRVPLACNAFAIFGDAAGGGHYFGRDFMFPPCGVLPDTACLLIVNPMTEGGGKPYPIVSVTAPGIIGSIAAMNTERVTAGVDVLAAANCNARRPGLNSLPLVRRSVQYGGTSEEAVDVIVAARRGVPWLYVISDGKRDEGKVACVVEAGETREEIDFLSYPRDDLQRKDCLPDTEYLSRHPTAEQRRGLMVRWNGYLGPERYVDDFNVRLWNEMDGGELAPDAFEPRGFISRWEGDRPAKVCPQAYYFPPQRESRPDVVLVSNHALIPEMRLCGMSRLTSTVLGEYHDDIQWRYDELNHRILSALDQGPIDRETAKELIDFLAKVDGYYGKPDEIPGTPIEGATSLFDLREGTVESHFGYHGDDWVRITLPSYIV
ncbi:MAG: C45 family peptidase [Planctomycetota bacterium]|jgi:hypothetical protein